MAFQQEVTLGSRTNLESEELTLRRACTRIDFVYERSPSCETSEREQETYVAPMILPRNSSGSSKDWLRGMNTLSRDFYSEGQEVSSYSSIQCRREHTQEYRPRNGKRLKKCVKIDKHHQRKEVMLTLVFDKDLHVMFNT